MAGKGTHAFPVPDGHRAHNVSEKTSEVPRSDPSPDRRRSGPFPGSVGSGPSPSPEPLGGEQSTLQLPLPGAAGPGAQGNLGFGCLCLSRGGSRDQLWASSPPWGLSSTPATRAAPGSDDQTADQGLFFPDAGSGGEGSGRSRAGSPWEAPQGFLGQAPHSCPPIPGQPGHRQAMGARSGLCPQSARSRGQTPSNRRHKGVCVCVDGARRDRTADGGAVALESQSRAGSPAWPRSVCVCVRTPLLNDSGCRLREGAARIRRGAWRQPATHAGSGAGPGARAGRRVPLWRPHQRRAVRRGSPGRSESHSWCRRWLAVAAGGPLWLGFPVSTTARGRAFLANHFRGQEPAFPLPPPAVF